MKNLKRLFPAIFIGAIVAVFFSNCAIINVLSMPSDMYVTMEEIDEANREKMFGQFVQMDFDKNDVSTGSGRLNAGEVVFKLFGLIPIKKTNVKLLPEEEVYIGGNPIGLSVDIDGVLVVADSVVDASTSSIAKNPYFKNGDLIVEINDQKISSLSDIDAVLSNFVGEFVDVKVIRKAKQVLLSVPLLKNDDNALKLGIWVRDDLSGIGTLTFAKQENNQFMALGHAITNGKDEGVLPVINGEIYKSSLVGIEKGERNAPGELRCVFVNRDKCGQIDKNTKVGISGRLESVDDVVDSNKKAYLGGRLSVKPGKAKLVSSVSGILDEYDIEIIKANYQSKCDDKSFVFRVKDERLLKLTGGIVQGMSGSPIIQEGKMVGAVTHVFISDSTKGYGVYTDWMMEQLEA